MEETFAACIALGRRCGFEEEHCLQDARLAVRLFDLTTDLHHLEDEDRDLLYCAGLLHDIGYVEGYWGHHKTAYRLIMKADLPQLTEREKRVVANVARYHRGARPKLTHKGFAALDRGDREIRTMLAVIPPFYMIRVSLTFFRSRIKVLIIEVKGAYTQQGNSHNQQALSFVVC